MGFPPVLGLVGFRRPCQFWRRWRNPRTPDRNVVDEESFLAELVHHIPLLRCQRRKLEDVELLIQPYPLQPLRVQEVRNVFLGNTPVIFEMDLHRGKTTILLEVNRFNFSRNPFSVPGKYTEKISFEKSFENWKRSIFKIVL